MEKNPEIWQSQRSKDAELLLAKVAMFDELIDMHHDGVCTFAEAMSQFQVEVAILTVEA